MKIPLIYNIRSVRQRPVSTALTALGIGLVVAVFVAMLALANGFVAALVTTGSSDNVLLLRRGADSEMSSGIPREAVSIIGASPHIAAGEDGKPMISPETYIVINLVRPGGDAYSVANVVARGVSDKRSTSAATSRSSKDVASFGGRARSASAQAAGTLANVAVGGVLRFANRDWNVVCRFTAEARASSRRSGARTEQFQSVFRGWFQDIAFRLEGSGVVRRGEARFLADQRIRIDAHRESEFYASQSELLGNILRFSPS